MSDGRLNSFIFVCLVETHQVRDADFPFFLLFLAQSVLRQSFSRFPFFPQLFCWYVNILYFLLFHLSLSELSVSFCVHFL